METQPGFAVPPTPHYPLGLPLTESMGFTARGGTEWLAYVEGVPPAPRRRWRRRALLPGRRLRFDSAWESRVVGPVPAGSPFLADARLQELLDRSVPLALAELGPPATSASRRWFRDSAPARRALWSRTRQLAGGAADQVIVWVAGLLGSRPRARF